MVHCHLHSHEAPATEPVLHSHFAISRQATPLSPPLPLRYQPPSRSTVTSTLMKHQPLNRTMQSSTPILLSAAKPVHCHLHSHFAISRQASPLSPPLPLRYQPPSHPTVTSTPTSLSATKPVHCHLKHHFTISHRTNQSTTTHCPSIALPQVSLHHPSTPPSH